MMFLTLASLLLIGPVSAQTSPARTRLDAARTEYCSLSREHAESLVPAAHEIVEADALLRPLLEWIVPAALATLGDEVFSDPSFHDFLVRQVVPSLEAECVERVLGICVQSRMDTYRDAPPVAQTDFVSNTPDPVVEPRAGGILGRERHNLHSAVRDVRMRTPDQNSVVDFLRFSTLYNAAQLRALERLLDPHFDVVLCTPAETHTSSIHCHMGARGQAIEDMMQARLFMDRMGNTAILGRLEVFFKRNGHWIGIDARVMSPAFRATGCSDNKNRIYDRRFGSLLVPGTEPALYSDAAARTRDRHLRASLPDVCAE